MMRLVLTERAQLDLILIEDYSIGQWGGRVAGEYLARFQHAFDLLAASPQLLRSHDDYGDWLRFYRVEKHWLVCMMVDEDIYVLTVCHGMMDMPSRVGDLAPQLLQETELMHNRLNTRDRDDQEEV